MRKVAEYHIVNSKDVYDLERFVRNYCSNGWHPIGGICVRNHTYHQSMVRYQYPWYIRAWHRIHLSWRRFVGKFKKDRPMSVFANEPYAHEDN